jgi:hypothetical protein
MPVAQQTNTPMKLREGFDHSSTISVYQPSPTMSRIAAH